MRRVIRLEPREIRPAFGDVLRHQGMPPGAAVSPRVRGLLVAAKAAFDELVAPVAIREDVSHDEFTSIYQGAGLNEAETPMPGIARRADRLALFAATIGDGLEHATRRRLHANDPALACTLDAFASAAAERLSELVAREYLASIRPAEPASPTHVFAYSPGYCGWHVTGQQWLFERLRPGEIGIELTGRCVMTPIKSVSGVLVAGPREAHRVRPSYPICETCVTRACRERMRALREAH